MRVQPTSMESDVRDSHTACDTPKKGLDIAAHELQTLLSAEKKRHFSSLSTCFF